MIILVHPAVQGVLLQLSNDMDQKVGGESARECTHELAVLTSYLPTYERGPFGGIERLKAMRAAGTVNPVVVLSVHSLQELLSFPQNGILHEAGSSHIRLPADLSRTLTKQNPPPVSSVALRQIVLRSCTITGQLTLFLDRLLEGLCENGTANPFHRLNTHGLLAFCQKHFPGWFKSDLEVLHNVPTSDSYPSVVKALTSMRSSVGHASICIHFSKLEHGKSLDIINKGFGPMRVMALNSERGLIAKEVFSQYMKNGLLVSEFMIRLMNICDEFAAAVELDNNLSPQLGKSLKRFIDVGAKFSSASTVTEFINSPGTMIASIDELIDALSDVKGLAANTVQQ